MRKKEINKLRDEYIKLRAGVKAANLVEDGVEAKLVIQDGLVKVNNEVDIRRGRKLYDGDVVSFDGHERGLKNKSMYIESLELKISETMRNCLLFWTRGRISFMEIMLRGRQMCSRLFIFAEPQNLTGEVRIKR